MTRRFEDIQPRLVQLKGQLRRDMTEDRLFNWHAEVSSILCQFPHLEQFAVRLNNIVNNEQSVGEKVVSARDLMGRLSRSGPWVSTSGAGNSTVRAQGENTSQTVTIILPQNMSQTQNQILKSIYPTWDAVEEEIDNADDMSHEDKSKAKEIAKDIWDGVLTGSKDAAAFVTAAASLGALTGHAQAILKLIGIT